MKTHRHSAFTLVELLVVIAIIGMLMALLLPAVNSAKETGRRAVCLNNEKQLMLAMRNYEQQKRELPGYANGVGKGFSGDDLNFPHGRLATWVVMLFPFLERTDVYSKWSDSTFAVSASNPLPMPYMEVLVCPSNPPDSATGPVLAYVANCGIKDPGLRTLPPITSGAAEKAANGVFFNRYNPVTPANRATFMQISMSLDKIPDGASNTLMLSENLAAFHYTDETNTSGLASLGQYAQANASAECGVGFTWDPNVTGIKPTKTGQTSPAEQINGSDPQWDLKKNLSYRLASNPQSNLGTPQAYYYSRPSSYHNGGVNAAFCGGEVIFLRDDIDYKVYQQLMTSDGKHSDMPPANIDYVLNDSDYK